MSLKVCRMCLKVDTKLYVILNTPLQGIYEKITNIPLENGYSRPVTVCYICHHLLVKLGVLIKKIIKADEVFKQIIDRGLEITAQSIQDANTSGLQLSLVKAHMETYTIHTRPAQTDNVQIQIKTEIDGDIEDDELMKKVLEQHADNFKIDEPAIDSNAGDVLDSLKTESEFICQDMTHDQDLGVEHVKTNTQKQRANILQKKREYMNRRYQLIKSDPQKREKMQEKDRSSYLRKKEMGLRKLVKDMTPKEHKAAKEKWRKYGVANRVAKRKEGRGNNQLIDNLKIDESTIRSEAGDALLDSVKMENEATSQDESYDRTEEEFSVEHVKTNTRKKRRKMTRAEKLQKKREYQNRQYQLKKSDPQKREEMKEMYRLSYLKKKEMGFRKLAKDMTPKEHKAAKEKWKEYNANRKIRKQEKKESGRKGR